MPEGLQWTLRPLSSRFCRKAWRRPRSAAAKPLPVRPGFCPQPASTGGSLKVAARQPQPEAAPSKARVPRLIQPAPLLQPLPRLQPLRLQPALPGAGGGGSFKLLSAPQPRPCLVPSVPVAFQPQVVLPLLPAPKPRRPSGPRAFQKRKGPKAAPLLQPAPVLFTVPAGAVKVVGIANGCGVLHPLAAPGGRPAQRIPITTLLVNPAPFPCPLGQPLASAPASPLVLSSGPALAAPPDVEAAGSWAVGAEPREPPPCAVASPEGGRDPQQPDPDHGGPAEAQAEVVAAAEEVLLPAQAAFSPVPGLGEAVKVEFEEPPGAPQEPEQPSVADTPVKEELVLGLGQELDVDPAPERVKKEQGAGALQSPWEPEDGGHGGSGPCPEGSSSSPGNPSDEVGGPAVKSEEPPGPAPPAGHEAAGEKEGPEEEEEEDFDDLTQDEEDEEMSSASEESVLSVPELQVSLGGALLSAGTSGRAAPWEDGGRGPLLSAGPASEWCPPPPQFDFRRG